MPRTAYFAFSCILSIFPMASFAFFCILCILLHYSPSALVFL